MFLLLLFCDSPRGFLSLVDVTQAVFFFLQSEVMENTLLPQDMLAAIVAAAIHDFAHPVRLLFVCLFLIALISSFVCLLFLFVFCCFCAY